VVGVLCQLSGKAVLVSALIRAEPPRRTDLRWLKLSEKISRRAVRFRHALTCVAQIGESWLGSTEDGHLGK
jgi:hypothetical protein